MKARQIFYELIYWPFNWMLYLNHPLHLHLLHQIRWDFVRANLWSWIFNQDEERSEKKAFKQKHNLHKQLLLLNKIVIHSIISNNQKVQKKTIDTHTHFALYLRWWKEENPINILYSTFFLLPSKMEKYKSIYCQNYLCKVKTWTQIITTHKHCPHKCTKFVALIWRKSVLQSKN